MTVCERPQFRPGGRSYSAEAIIRLTAGSSPAHRASSTFPPGLWVPLSLYASLPLSVFVSPFGLPDVPGYLPLSSLVQGTKATTRKEVRGEIKGWRWKRTFTAIRELHKQLGRFCDILNDMECPVSPLLIVGNAAGVVMIGHYVGLRRRTYFTFFFFFLGATSKTWEFPWFPLTVRSANQANLPQGSEPHKRSGTRFSQASLTCPRCGNILSFALAEVETTWLT